jgi:malate synthase
MVQLRGQNQCQITAGVRKPISVSLHALDSWLRGRGCVPLNTLREDAATVEIARAPIWQGIRPPWGMLDEERKVTVELWRQWMTEEAEKSKATLGERVCATRHLQRAAEILDQVVTSEQFIEFLTLPA